MEDLGVDGRPDLGRVPAGRALLGFDGRAQGPGFVVGDAVTDAVAGELEAGDDSEGGDAGLGRPVVGLADVALSD